MHYKSLSKKNIISFVIRFGIAFGIIYYLINSNYEELIKTFRSANVQYIIVASFLYLIHLIIVAWRWSFLTKIQNVNIKLIEAFSLSMQGLFFSLVLPGGAIGGDIVKASFVAKRIENNKSLGVFSILIDRVMGMFGLFLLTPISILLALSFILNSNNTLIKTTSLFVFVICLSGIFSGLALIFHKKLQKIKLFDVIISYIQNKFTIFKKLLLSVDAYKNSYKSLLISIIVSIIFVHLNLSLVLYLLAISVGVVSPSYIIILLALTFGNVASLLPTPSGIGTRDITIITILIASGINEGQANAIPLIFTAILLVFNMLGGLFFIFSTTKKGLK